MARAVVDKGNTQTTLYLNGSPVVQWNAVAGFPETDDPGLVMGASDNGNRNGVEWDYVRVYKGALDGTTPLGPVPEPTSMALLGLGGLALLFRRRR